MAEEVERVTDPAAPDQVPETAKNKTAKNPKKVAAGRAGCRPKGQNARSTSGAKESFRSSAVPPRERPVFLQRKQSRRIRNMQTNGSMYRNITVKDEVTGPHGS